MHSTADFLKNECSKEVFFKIAAVPAASYSVSRSLFAVDRLSQPSLAYSRAYEQYMND